MRSSCARGRQPHAATVVSALWWRTSGGRSGSLGTRHAPFAPGPRPREGPNIVYRENVTETTYVLHGLRVRSEVPLAERIAGDGEHDVGVRWGDEVAIPAEPPPGRVLALQDPDV